MRDATDTEEESLRQGICPFCGSDDWTEGPHGGLAVNYYCNGCPARFNLTGPFRSQIIATPDDKTVALTEIGAAKVSTVKLDYNNSGQLFETMIFGGPRDLDTWRWPTETAALAGHDRIVAALRDRREPRDVAANYIDPPDA